MEQYDLWKLDKKLQKEVDEDRYHHTLGVMFTAASMAMVWGEDLEKARVAGLLHDCATVSYTHLTLPTTPYV